MDQRNTPPGEALPASALPLPHEVLVWRGMKATPTVVLIDAFVVGDQLEKALIEETARRRRAEVLLFATQQAYVREHGKASVVPSETALNSAAQERPLYTNGGRATGHIGQPSECLTARGEAPRVPARAECNDKVERAKTYAALLRDNRRFSGELRREVARFLEEAFVQSAGVARIECSNCGAKYERYEAPCPHCSFSAVPSASAALLKDELDKMEKDHIVSGGPGPLYGAGWAAACAHWAKRLRAATDRSADAG